MKRPHMPMKVKLDACLILLGFDPDSVEWHHDPALELRPYTVIYPDTDDVYKAKILYFPDANDPRYIRPMAKEDHKRQTFGTGKPREGDIKTIAHVRRMTKKQKDFRDKMLAKEIGVGVEWIKSSGYDNPGRKIPSRPFPKRKNVTRASSKR